MTRWVDGRPGYWWGWSDLGPIEIPSLPPFQLFTDRVTAQIWWLQLDPTFTFVQITTASPPKGLTQVLYTPFNEPYITGATPGIAQLFVANGVLTVGATIPLPNSISDIETQPIYARNAPTGGTFGTTLGKMVLIPGTHGQPNAFGFTKVVYTPVTNPVCPPPCT